MDDYDKKFNSVIEAILNELYHDPMNMGDSKIKRKVIVTEKRFVDYLMEFKLVLLTNNFGSGKYGLQLDRNGYEVFEKYGGWYNYKKKIIDKITKTEEAKLLSQRFWWIPIFISAIALIISVIALFHK